jgi:hypothetical protein
VVDELVIFHLDHPTKHFTILKVLLQNHFFVLKFDGEFPPFLQLLPWVRMDRLLVVLIWSFDADVPPLEVLVDHFGSECLEVIGTDVEGDTGSLVQIGGTNLR